MAAREVAMVMEVENGREMRAQTEESGANRVGRVKRARRSKTTLHPLASAMSMG